MITTLDATTTDGIVSALLSHEGVAGGSRVLTLVVDTDAAGLEKALEAAHGASRDHPCRIVALVRPEAGDVCEPDGRLDAQIRVGHHAGAGETIVLLPRGRVAEHVDTLVVPFLLPDVPVVVWWPCAPPEHPASSPLGRLATTRITNTPALPDPSAALAALAPSSVRGDIDLAWTRITLWRAMVASILDPVLRDQGIDDIVVAGEPANASVSLIVCWLRLRLGVPVERVDVPGAHGIDTITARTPAGELVIARTDHERVSIRRPGAREPQVVIMARREPVSTMNEELRRLTPDLVYEEVLASFAAECSHRAVPAVHAVDAADADHSRED